MADFHPIDALISGAGPTGLTMAIECARHGVSCRIIDKAPGPSIRSKAIAIQPRTLEVFQLMGVVDQFLAAGKKIRAVNLYDEGRRIVNLPFCDLDSRYPFLLSLPQSETERILTAHLEKLGIAVEHETELTEFIPYEGGVANTVRGHERSREFHSRWLIGCDGPHSLVRHKMDIEFAGADYSEMFLLADVHLDGDFDAAEFHLFFSGNGIAALFPMPNDRWRLVADAGGRASEVDPTLEECQDIANVRTRRNVRLSDLSWSAAFRIHRRIAQTLQSGRVFLAGDAAHIHSPAGAQGMNTGIQDAFNLVWKLGVVRKGFAGERFLDTYHRERYPVEEDVLRGSDIMTRVATLRNVFARNVRDAIAMMATAFGVVQSRLRDRISELAVNYRESPVVEDHGGSGDIVAGDRSPDRAVNGQSIYEMLNGGKHAVLAVGEHAEIPPRIRERWAGIAEIATSEEIPESFGRGVYVIRPDSYVGFRDGSGNSDKLERYLGRLYPGRPGVSGEER